MKIQCKTCKKEFKVWPCMIKNGRKYCSFKCRDNDKEFIDKIRKSKLGNKNPAKRYEVREKISSSIANLNKWKKEKNPNWKGGFDKGDSERKNFKVGYWREKVLELCGDSCTLCDKKYKHIHHILSWRNHPELRYNVYNGMPLCHSCHSRIEGEV